MFEHLERTIFALLAFQCQGERLTVTELGIALGLGNPMIFVGTVLDGKAVREPLDLARDGLCRSTGFTGVVAAFGSYHIL